MRFGLGLLVRAFVLVSVAAPSAADQSAPSPERLIPRKIAEDLYLLTGAGANVTALVTEHGIVVVDSGNNPGDGADIARSLGRLSPAPVRYLVYTHYHNDHVGGGAGFPATTVVVSHANTRPMVSAEARIMGPPLLESLERKAAALRKESPEWKAAQQELDRTRKALDAFSKQPFVLPHVTFDSRLTLHVGDDEVRLLYLGPGHTNGDVIVHFPRQRVLHIGDLLGTNDWPPRLDGDAGARFDSLSKILDAVAQMPVDQIVPGHGDAVDKAGYLRVSAVKRRYLTGLRDEVARLMRQGLTRQQVKDRLRLPKDPEIDSAMSDALLPWNVDALFRELAAKSGPPE